MSNYNYDPNGTLGAQIAGILSAALALSREESGVKVTPYRPSFKRIAGSTNGALILERIWFWFSKMGYQAFYKFVEPCNHPDYVQGESWNEELGFTWAEFKTAMNKLGTKVEKGVSKIEAYETSIVVWWTDSSRRTWFDMNLINFARAIEKEYADTAENNRKLKAYLGRLDYLLTDPEALGNLTTSDYLDNPTDSDYLVIPQSQDSFHIESTTESTTLAKNSPKGESSAQKRAPRGANHHAPVMPSTPKKVEKHPLETLLLELSSNRKKELTEAQTGLLYTSQPTSISPDGVITRYDPPVMLYDTNVAYKKWVDEYVTPISIKDKQFGRGKAVGMLIGWVTSMKAFERWMKENVSVSDSPAPDNRPATIKAFGED